MMSSPRQRALLAALLAVVAIATAATSTAGAFSNGRADPARDLAQIHMPGSSIAYLAKGGAVASINTARLCAVPDGVDLYASASQWNPAATAYRNIAVQTVLWQRYKSGTGAPAAVPGTSNHGWGNAIDLAQVRMATWMLKHGRQFGWSHDEGARVGEWWHYRYVGGFNRPDPGQSLRFPNLRKGSGGACQATAVREVQRRLGLTRDGEYGPATARAVRRFQRKYKLRVDGRVESKTWLKLRKVGRDLSASRDPRTVAQLPGSSAPMVGQDVRAVQGLLNARFSELRRPQYAVPVTGVLDQATVTAIKRFQRLRKLPATGRVDDRTYAELTKKLAKPTPKLRVTIGGANLVADFEGFRSCPYRDVVGVWTIGFGHTAGVGPSSECLTRKAGVALLHRDLNLFALQVTKLVHRRPGLRQFNGLVSFSYNVGAGALGSSTLLREFNAGHVAEAAAQFKRWNRAGGHELLGLTRRRRAECDLFVRGSSKAVQRKRPCS